VQETIADIEAVTAAQQEEKEALLRRTEEEREERAEEREALLQRTEELQEVFKNEKAARMEVEAKTVNLQAKNELLEVRVEGATTKLKAMNEQLSKPKFEHQSKNGTKVRRSPMNHYSSNYSHTVSLSSLHFVQNTFVRVYQPKVTTTEPVNRTLQHWKKMLNDHIEVAAELADAINDTLKSRPEEKVSVDKMAAVVIERNISLNVYGHIALSVNSGFRELVLPPKESVRKRIAELKPEVLTSTTVEGSKVLHSAAFADVRQRIIREHHNVGEQRAHS